MDSESDKIVLILTRPEKESRKWAAQLSTDIFNIHILPLISIESIPFTIPDSHFDQLIFTSAQAISHFNNGLSASDVEKFKTLPAYCVGPKTADAAQAYGYHAEIPPEVKDALTMMEFAGVHLLNSNSLWPCGHLSLERKINVPDKVTSLPVYNTGLHSYSQPELDLMLPLGRKYVFLCSPSAARAWFSLPIAIKANTFAVSIGPSTTNECADLRISVLAEALKPNVQSMAEALLLKLYLDKRQ